MSEATATFDAQRDPRRPARRPRRAGRGPADRLGRRCSSSCCSPRSTSRSSGSRTGFAVSGAIVGAIGLNLLVGTTGQLSLAHAFFIAVGAVTYVFVSGESGASGSRTWPVSAGRP